MPETGRAGEGGPLQRGWLSREARLRRPTEPAEDAMSDNPKRLQVFRKLGEPCPECKRPDALEVVGVIATDTWLRCEHCGWEES